MQDVPIFHFKDYQFLSYVKCVRHTSENRSKLGENALNIDVKEISVKVNKAKVEHIIKVRGYAPRLERHRLIFRNLEFSEIKNVLDVGCGLGEFLEAVNSPDTLKVGLDLDIHCISKAKKQVKANFIRGSALCLPFTNNFFDLVTAIGICEHVENPTLLVKDVYRVCKNMAVFVTPNLARPSRLVPAALGKDCRGFQGHKQGWDYYLFKHFLENSGWKVIRLVTRFVDFPLYRLLPKRLGRFMSYKVLLKLFPRIGSELFAFCRKVKK